MGGGQSADLPPPPNDFDHLLLAFHAGDKIVALHPREEVIKAIVKNVKLWWHAGIKSETTQYGEARIFKLSGYPFDGCNLDQSIQLKRMLCHLLADLRRIGWELVLSSTMQTSENTSTLFFRRTHPLPEFQLVCLSMSSTDALQLVNGNPALRHGLRSALRAVVPEWSLAEAVGPDAMEVDLRNELWKPKDEEMAIKAKELMLAIIKQFCSIGYTLYGTANPKGNNDCLFFQKEPGASNKDVMLMTITGDDEIRLFGSNEPLRHSVRNCVIDNWDPTIVESHHHQEPYFLTLAEKPWASKGDKDLYSKLLVLNLFRSMRELGWKLLTGIDMSLTNAERTAFLFTKDIPCTNVPHLCLAPIGEGNLRIVQFDDEDVIRTVVNSYRKHWLRGVEKEEPHPTLENALELHLVGKLWNCGSSSNDLVLAEDAFLMLLYELNKQGWRPAASACLNMKNRDTSDSENRIWADVDTVFFVKED